MDTDRIILLLCLFWRHLQRGNPVHNYTCYPSCYSLLYIGVY